MRVCQCAVCVCSGVFVRKPRISMTAVREQSECETPTPARCKDRLCVGGREGRWDLLMRDVREPSETRLSEASKQSYGFKHPHTRYRT